MLPQSRHEMPLLHTKLLSSSQDLELHELLSKQLVVLQKALDINYELTENANHHDSLWAPRAQRKSEASIPTDFSSRFSVPPSPGLSESSYTAPLNLPNVSGLKDVSDLTSVSPKSSLKKARGLSNASDATPWFRDLRGTYDSSKSQLRALGSRVSCKSSAAQFLFPNKQEIKASVEKALNTPAYSVEEHYHKTGLWQAIARNEHFGNFILFAIVLNTIWLGFDTDYNKAVVLCNAPLVCQIVDNFFTALFVVEIFARFMAYQSKMEAIKERTFVIDGVLVALMVWENWVLVAFYLFYGRSPQVAHAKGTSFIRVFRAFRLMRIARAARLFNSIPELLILAKAMTVAVRSVVSIMVLLTLVIYIFALVFTQLLSGSAVAAGKFETVPQSMNFLLLSVLCGFDADYIGQLLTAGVAFYILYLFFLFLSSLTIMNMLIGILCEVVAAAADSENIVVFEQDLAAYIDEIAAKTDTDNSCSIDREEFGKMVKNPDMVRHLDALGVDVVSIASMADYVFSQVDELAYCDFAHWLGQFRGGQQAKVQDVMDAQKFISYQLSALQDAVTSQMQAVEMNLAAFREAEAKVLGVRPDQHQTTFEGQNSEIMFQ